MIFGDRHVLRLSTAADDAKHSIADFPHAHLIADLLNFAGEFNPGNVLGITGRRGIAAEALQDVRTIQSGGVAQ